MRRLLPIFLLLSLFITSCSERPDYVMSEGKMKSVLIDMYKADAYLGSGAPKYGSDSMRRVLRQSILAKHGVTQAEFDSTLVWYGHHIDDYVELYTEIEADLNEQLVLARKKGRESGEMAGGAISKADNLWTDMPIKILSHNSDKDYIGFELTESDGLNIGDRIYWNFRKTNSQSDIEMYIAVDYENGNTSYMTNKVPPTTGKCKISIQTDTINKINRIYGYAKFLLKNDEIVFVDSIQIEKKPFIEANYTQINMQRNFDPKYKESEKESNVVDSLDNNQLATDSAHTRKNEPTMPRTSGPKMLSTKSR